MARGRGALVDITTYKKIRIQYDEDKESFIASDSKGDEVSRAASLKSVKERIDRISSKDFKRIPIFAKEGGYSSESFIEGEITSVNPDTKDVWVVSKGGTRFKISAYHREDYLAKVTPENREKIHKIEALSKQKDSIDKEIEKLEKSLERPTDADLGFTKEENT